MFKKLNLLAVILLSTAFTLVFYGCKKDDNGGGSGSNKPTLTDFTPKSGGTGTTVTISGTNLTGATAVSFGGVAAASYVVVNATTITAVVGTGATGDVSVTTPNGTATLAGFTYNAPPPPAPTITSFTPTTVGTGGTVTITGTNFTGASAVKFGNTAATSYTVVNATTITAIVGAGTSGDVSVTTAGGTATKSGFTFSNSLLGKINGDTELKQLSSGIATANLGTALSGAGPFTVFAPVDAALNALTVNFGTLAQSTADLLIRYHTIPGKVLSTDIPVTENLKVQTINSPADSLFITKVASGTIYVNGKNVNDAKRDIAADNGVIHKLNSSNGLLLPPARNIYDQLSVAGYDSIKKLVARAALADANLIDNLKTNEVLTLIAPTNGAFTSFFTGNPFITQIDQFTPAQALALLKDHMLVGRKFVINLVLATNAGSGALGYGGAGLKIGNTSSGLALYYSPSAAVLLGGNDVMCFNGVIHRVSGILTK
jgi:uncharacterized surface protein with fasciclin (FAS1) repeats